MGKALLKLFGLCVVLAIIATVVTMATVRPSKYDVPVIPFSETPEGKARAVEALAKKQADDAREDARRQRIEAAILTVKGALRDPDSVVWESARANNDGTVVCIEYRARNGFGGMNRGYAAFANGKISADPPLWNKHCTQPLPDASHYAEQIESIARHMR